MTWLDKDIQKVDQWLGEFEAEVPCSDRRKAYHAFGAGLHALRDRLTIEEAADLGAQLPTILRGLYYEGWHPHGKPLKVRSRSEYLELVRDYLGQDWTLDEELVARATFRLLNRHVSGGELEDVQHILPKAIVDLWDRAS
ncbi:DUF2267 domain-containing protein [Haliangium sp.]|uniref:DUF2267 domain-containing protein n=1 Tax=Haliangium sp. TaxID=2663208 RepID=UPI003D10F36B